MKAEAMAAPGKPEGEAARSRLRGAFGLFREIWRYAAGQRGLIVLAFSLRVQWRTVARAAGALRLEPDGVCILTNVSGALRGHVTGATVFPLFVRLVVTGDGRRSRTLLVMRDAVTPDGYRSLRARIVQRHLPVPASQPPV